jgi:hypothetical protein
MVAWAWRKPTVSFKLCWGYRCFSLGSIYVTGLVLKWVLEEGGVDEFARRSAAKSKLIYDVIDGSNGFFSCPVAPRVRSRVNIPFRICGSDGTPSEELEARFLKQAEAQSMISLKGHRCGRARRWDRRLGQLPCFRGLIRFAARLQVGGWHPCLPLQRGDSDGDRTARRVHAQLCSGDSDLAKLPGGEHSSGRLLRRPFHPTPR